MLSDDISSSPLNGNKSCWGKDILHYWGAITNLVYIVSTPDNNLWEYVTHDRKSMKLGMDFITPYIVDVYYSPSLVPRGYVCCLQVRLKMNPNTSIYSWKRNSNPLTWKLFTTTR